MHLNPLAIAVAVVAAFILSSTYYAVFARRMASLHPAYATTSKTPAWKPLLELVRNVVLALVVAGLVDAADIDGLGQTLALAGALWAGFPLVLLTGSIIWEKVAWRLAAMHAGDWLAKLAVICLIIGLWR